MKTQPSLHIWLFLLLTLLIDPAMVSAEEQPFTHQGTLQQLRRDGRTLIVAM
ncbi:MAG: hypothetical protein G8345_17600, partial [Magnetococcales bacterium]|nr:hypothetical protein [Magnetococcales bacterium]